MSQLNVTRIVGIRTEEEEIKYERGLEFETEVNIREWGVRTGTKFTKPSLSILCQPRALCRRVRCV